MPGINERESTNAPKETGYSYGSILGAMMGTKKKDEKNNSQEVDDVDPLDIPGDELPVDPEPTAEKKRTRKPKPAPADPGDGQAQQPQGPANPEGMLQQMAKSVMNQMGDVTKRIIEDDLDAGQDSVLRNGLTGLIKEFAIKAKDTVAGFDQKELAGQFSHLAAEYVRKIVDTIRTARADMRIQADARKDEALLIKKKMAAEQHKADFETAEQKALADARALALDERINLHNMSIDISNKVVEEIKYSDLSAATMELQSLYHISPKYTQQAIREVGAHTMSESYFFNNSSATINLKTDIAEPNGLEQTVYMLSVLPTLDCIHTLHSGIIDAIISILSKEEQISHNMRDKIIATLDISAVIQMSQIQQMMKHWDPHIAQGFAKRAASPVPAKIKGMVSGIFSATKQIANLPNEEIEEPEKPVNLPEVSKIKPTSADKPVVELNLEGLSAEEIKAAVTKAQQVAKGEKVLTQALKAQTQAIQEREDEEARQAEIKRINESIQKANARIQNDASRIRRIVWEQEQEFSQYAAPMFLSKRCRVEARNKALEVVDAMDDIRTPATSIIAIVQEKIDIPLQEIGALYACKIEDLSSATEDIGGILKMKSQLEGLLAATVKAMTTGRKEKEAHHVAFLNNIINRIKAKIYQDKELTPGILKFTQNQAGKALDLGISAAQAAASVAETLATKGTRVFAGISDKLINQPINALTGKEQSTLTSPIPQIKQPLIPIDLDEF